jgi:hypothetical protein
MPPDFILLSILRRRGVPHVIIGGHAVNFHGYLRSTEDLDIVWLRSPESEKALAALLAEVNATYLGKEIDPATGLERAHPVNLPFVQANHLMMLWTDVEGFLDLFDHIPGHPNANVEDLFATSIEHGGNRFASLEWLRKMKKSAGRPKDLLDLRNLPEEPP